MNSPHITYVALGGDANPQTELSVLANIYMFVLDCHERKGATSPGSPDDARKDQE